MSEQVTPVYNADQISITQEIIKSLDCLENIKPFLLAREQKGIATYGTTLQPFNGRDARQDLLEELLDAVQYAKQNYIEHPEDLFMHSVYIECLKFASNIIERYKMKIDD